jgi:ribosomal protein S18 acetylase RimI-like enzyme
MGDSITEIIEEARRAKKRQIADRERALAGTPAMPERTGAKAPEWWERNVEGRVEKALPSVMGAIAPPIAKAWQKFEEYAPHLATIAQLYGPDILRGTEIGWRLLGLGGGAVVPGVEAFPLGKALTTGRDILDARDPDREPVPFEPPKLEKYPGAAKAFWEGLTEEGDVWTRLESAIEAAQDELEAGWGYWAASEAATSAVAPFAAARGGVGLTRAAAPLAQTLARPVSRVAPRAAPSIERGIEAGIRGLGAGLQVPFMVEEAAGRAIAAPFRRGQPRRGLVEEAPVGGLTLEEADAIIGPTVAEMEVSRAAAMARGPRAKLAILQERHKEAEDAVRALEARLPQARQRLEMPAVAEAPPAAPGAPAREVGAERAWDVDDWNRFITAEEERLVRMPDAPEPYQGPARSILDKITRGTGRGEHTVLNEQEQALLRQFIDEEGIDSEFLGLTSRIWTGEDEVIMGIMPRKLFGAGWKGHEYITWAPAKNTFIIHSTRPDPYEVMRAGGKFQFSPRAIAGARDVRGIEGIRPPAALGAPGGPPPAALGAPGGPPPAALGAPAGPPPAALVTPDVPVTPPTTLPGAPVARVQSVVTGFREGASTQPLPSVGQLKDNYSKPLSEYTDRLFHETNMDGASSSLAYSDNYQRDIFFANNADMARGQTGKGVLLEFSAEGVEGQINRSKPGWAFAFDGGDAEFIARTSRSEMSNNLISVTVEKGVFQAQRLKPGGKWLNPDTLYVRRTIQDWPKTTNADGSVTYVRPADPWKIQATSVGVVDAPAALVTPGARPTASYEDAFAIYEQSKLAKNIESLSQSAKQDYRARDPVEAFRNSASKLIGDIDASETITVWHGTNITNARQILKSGQIIGDQWSYGPGVTISPDAARKFSGSARGAREGFRADRGPVVLQFEINAKQFLRDFVPDIHAGAGVFTTARVNSILDIDPSKVKLLYDTPATSPFVPIRRLISDLSDEELERFNVVARAHVQRNEQMQRQAQLRGDPVAPPVTPAARAVGEEVIPPTAPPVTPAVRGFRVEGGYRNPNTGERRWRIENDGSKADMGLKDDGVGYFVDLKTPELLRRQGFAEDLIRDGIQHLSDEGATSIRLYSEPGVSRQLFKKLGFEETGAKNRLGDREQFLDRAGIMALSKPTTAAPVTPAARAVGDIAEEVIPLVSEAPTGPPRIPPGRDLPPGPPIEGGPSPLEAMPGDFAPGFAGEVFGMHKIRPGITKAERFANLMRRTVGKPFREIDPRAMTERNAFELPAMKARAAGYLRVVSITNRVSALIEEKVKANFVRDRQGRIPKLFGIDTTLPGAPTIQDVAARLPTFSRALTPAQHTAMTEIRDELADIGLALRDVDPAGKIGVRPDVIRGGFYLPRGGAAFEHMERPLKLRAKQAIARTEGFERAAEFDSMAQGIAEGWEYGPLANALKLYVTGVGQKTIDADVARYFRDAINDAGELVGKTARRRAADSLIHDPDMAAIIASLRQEIPNLKSLGAKLTAGQTRLADSFMNDIGLTDIKKLRTVFTVKEVGVTSLEANRAEIQRGLKVIKNNLNRLSPAWQRNLKVAKEVSNPIDLPGLEGITFPDEIANGVNLIVREQRPWTGPLAPLGRAVEGFNNIYRGLRSTLDNSYGGLQGLLGFYNTPKNAAEALRLSILAWGANGERILGKFLIHFDRQALATGRANSRLWVRDGLRQGGAETEMALGRNHSILTRLPGIKQANRAFGYYGDALRLKWADDMLQDELHHGRTLKQVMDSGDFRRIAEMANSMTGWSTRRFGGSIGEMLMFAPRFLQSRLETVVKAALGLRPGAPLDQRIARRSMQKMIMVGTVLTFAVNEMLGQETDVRPLVPDGRGGRRYNSNFMRIRFMGRDWSLFGTWDSLLRAIIVTAGGEPQEAFRSMGSGVVSYAWDLWTGEDYIGEPVREDPLQFAEYMGKSMWPFAAEEVVPSVIGVAKGVAEKDPMELVRGVVTMTGEIHGAKSSLMAYGDVALERYGTGEPRRLGLPQRGLGVDIAGHELEPYQWIQARQDEELSGRSQFTTWDQIEADRMLRLEEITEEYTRDKWVNEYFSVEKFFSGVRAGANLGDELEPSDLNSSNPYKRALAEYYDVFDRVKTPGGLYPTGALDREFAKLDQKLRMDDMAKGRSFEDSTVFYVSRNTNTRPIPKKIWGALVASGSRTARRIHGSEEARALHQQIVEARRQGYELMPPPLVTR